jgi:hypothetical protein
VSESDALLDIIRRFAGQLDEEQIQDVAVAIVGALDRYERELTPDAEATREARAIATAARALETAIQNASDIAWYAIQKDDRHILGKDWLQAKSQIQFIRRIEVAAASAAARLSPKGRPVDRNRNGLAIEMALLWQAITGETVGVSSDQTFDEPRTRFAKFAAEVLALRSSTSAVRTGFSGFVKKAAEALGGNKSASAG